MAEQMTDSGIEWIGNIPASWNVAPAKFFFINNKKIAGTQSNNYQRLALTLKGVVKRSKEDSDGLQPKDFDTYQIVHSNNLIFKLIDLENVRTSRVGLSPWEGIVSPAYIILAPRDNIEIRYTEYFYKFMWFCEIFNKQGNEGVRNSINVDSLLRIPIVSPPLAEQRAIADHLDSVCTQIDTAIGFKEKQLEELANYKKSLISECVCRGVPGSTSQDVVLKDSGIERIGKIPEHWDKRRMKWAIVFQQNGNWGETPTKDTIPDNIKYCMRAADFDYQHLTFKDVETFIPRDYTGINFNKIKLMPGDILIERSGGGEKTPVGRALLFDDSKVDAGFSNFMERQRVASNVCLPKFYFYWWTARYQTGVYRQYFHQTTGIQNLNSTELINTEYMFLPSMQEQIEICSFLDKKMELIDDLTDSLIQEIQALEQYKKTTIWEYVTGKKRVSF